MFSPIAIPLLTVLLWLTTPTSQVNVQIGLSTGGLITCSNMIPGECCTVPTRHIPRPGLAVVSSLVIEQLLVRDIAAVFVATATKQGCNNIPPFKIYRGPSRVLLSNPGFQPYSGVSYLRLPQDWPPDVTNSEVLAAQGLLHLEAGGQKWTAPGITAPGGFFGLGAVASGSGFRKVKRGITAGPKGVAKGTVYLGAPRLSRYPDRITADGVDYRSGNTSALEYKDTNGNVLDLATIGL
ncbi:MAG: hypothetical protein LQ339_006236 [Xanthoria mediterranea]|nr:MAG: hypothetical protein LQ339_006236 [Xanthoria mediterranea]